MPVKLGKRKKDTADIDHSEGSKRRKEAEKPKVKDEETSDYELSDEEEEENDYEEEEEEEDAEEVEDDEDLVKEQIKELKQAIKKLSNDFKIPFGKLGMKKNTVYMSLKSKYKKQIRNYFYYKREEAGITPSKTLITPIVPSPSLPPPTNDYKLMQSLLNDTVEDSHKFEFAAILAKNAPLSLQQFYANKIVDLELNKITNYNLTDEMVSIVKAVPDYLKLKATGRILKKLKSKFAGGKDRPFMISIFNNLIKPSFKHCQESCFKEFDVEEVKMIKLVCEENHLHLLPKEDAFHYINLINSVGLFDIDKTKLKFFTMTQDTWYKILTKICGISQEIAIVWATNPDNVLTTAMLKHFKRNSTSLQFAQACTKFLEMTETNLNDLYYIMEYPNFTTLFDLLDQHAKHDFNVFKTQTELYMKLTKPQQIEAFKSLLAKTDLEDWHKHQDAIISSEQFEESARALQIIQQRIAQIRDSLDLKEPSELTLSLIKDDYKKALKYVSLNTSFQEMEWQKELVCNLVYLIVYDCKENIVVSLGTGHGKTFIIAILAEMLNMMNKYVSIVCLNEFLANWGRQKLCSMAVQNEIIEYLSINQLLLRIPDPKHMIIYDEIDQMLGANSLDFVPEGDQSTVTYKPKLMTSWKNVIGFSGTISQATMSQIRAELGNVLLLDIPSLRKDKNSNKIVKVTKADSKSKFPKVLKRIQELNNRVDNFIIILSDPTEVQKFYSLKEFKPFKDSHKVFRMCDFTQNYANSEKDLMTMQKNKFIVLTTKDGARGVDYKGLTPSHVILTFDPQSYSEAVQALGRGSRSLSKTCEGTVICENPLTLEETQYLKLLMTRDNERTQALTQNCKIARILHGLKFKPLLEIEVDEKISKGLITNEDPNELALLIFKTVMSKCENLQNIPSGNILWQNLKKMDYENKMPVNPHQVWR